jgi:hypothetical protein
VSFSAVSGFCIYSAPRENAQNLNGELAHRADFEHFPGADKARSASERPTVKNAERSEHGVLNSPTEKHLKI